MNLRCQWFGHQWIEPVFGERTITETCERCEVTRSFALPVAHAHEWKYKRGTDAATCRGCTATRPIKRRPKKELPV